MSPVVVAASVAHEMRTPLASIRMQAEAIEAYLPELEKGYQLAVLHGLVTDPLAPDLLARVTSLSGGITRQVDRSNVVIDVMLASARMENIDASSFETHSALECITEAIHRYPFSPPERQRTRLGRSDDFQFHGSDALLIYVIFNLLKNSLYALKVAGRGDIEISCERLGAINRVCVTDTGSGIRADLQPRIFDTFYTTKKTSGAGLGLAFCKRVMAAFGGAIRCESTEGEYCSFILEFPN